MVAPTMVSPALASPGMLPVVIGFAHRGAKAYAPENTLEAFALALRLGATGLESDVWLTADGIPVLDHDGVVKGRLRSKPIASVARVDLPSHIPTLEEMLSATPATVPLSLDVKDPAAFQPIVDTHRRLRPDGEQTLYLCHPDLDVLRTRVNLAPHVRLVHSTRIARMKDGPERHAAVLRETGIDVVNMPYPDWTGGLVALFKRFDLRCFAWDCQHERQIAEVVRMGVDAVYSDWPDRLADVL
jgi:glycerophosphoryl diester phosphodiesterase